MVYAIFLYALFLFTVKCLGIFLKVYMTNCEVHLAKMMWAEWAFRSNHFSVGVCLQNFHCHTNSSTMFSNKILQMTDILWHWHQFRLMHNTTVRRSQNMSQVLCPLGLRSWYFMPCSSFPPESKFYLSNFFSLFIVIFSHSLSLFFTGFRSPIDKKASK